MTELAVDKVTIADVAQLVDDGEYPEALELIKQLRGEGYALAARAMYHQHRYSEALEVIDLAGNNQRALLTKLNIRQVAEGFVDADEAKEILEQMNPSIGSLNSEVAKGINNPDVNSHELMRRGLEVVEGLTPENAVLNAVNLANNLSLIAMNNLKDLPKAEELINLAIECYGVDTHWHHRAGAHERKGNILAAMNRTDNAIEVLKESIKLWDEQLKKNNEPAFQAKRARVEKRLAELTS